jgi:hypothetical protein
LLPRFVGFRQPSGVPHVIDLLLKDDIILISDHGHYGLAIPLDDHIYAASTSRV